MSVGQAFMMGLIMALLVLGTYVFSGGFKTALPAGILAGLVLGRPDIGLEVGASCLLMSLGFFPYGGAVTPDYTMGALFGTVVAVQTGDSSQGIIIGSVVALIASWFNVLKGFINVRLIHAADKAAKNNNIRGVEIAHYSGMLMTMLVSNFLPVFLGCLLINNYTVISDFVSQYAWVKVGLQTISHLLPAVGFALLLSYMDIKKYWAFMIIGYVAFAYLKMPTVAIALLAAAVSYIYVFMIKNNASEKDKDEEGV